jgi:hypothetical protein
MMKIAGMLELDLDCRPDAGMTDLKAQWICR